MTLPSIMVLFGFMGACFLAATSGALFRPGEWYERLRKPRWRPPNWLFAPAWSFLYLTIAISGWLVWRRAGFIGASVPFTIFGVSLLFNAAWPAFFFGLRRPDLAFAELILLWLSIAAMIAAFYPVDRKAALFLLPYIGWVTFAGALNFVIWRMNRMTGRV
jgi:tryptophan-rich sensory protein